MSNAGNKPQKDNVALRDIVRQGRVRVSMNVHHLNIDAGGESLVQLDDGRFREVVKPSITISREDDGQSPWSRWYDLNDSADAEAIEGLKKLIEKHPNLSTDSQFRVRIVSEYDAAEPWPGYDEQNADQIRTYRAAMPPSHRPTLENMLAYELSRVSEDGETSLTDKKKVAVIEALHAEESSRQRAQSGSVAI